MTLEGIEKAIWAAVAAVLATLLAAVGALVAWVRGSDLVRLKALEDRQKDLEKAVVVSQDKLSAEIHQLRRDNQNQFEELVRLIVGRRE